MNDFSISVWFLLCLQLYWISYGCCLFQIQLLLLIYGLCIHTFNQLWIKNIWKNMYSTHRGFSFLSLCLNNAVEQLCKFYWILWVTQRCFKVHVGCMHMLYHFIWPLSIWRLWYLKGILESIPQRHRGLSIVLHEPQINIKVINIMTSLYWIDINNTINQIVFSQLGNTLPNICLLAET
jgi:hypothetical protein